VIDKAMVVLDALVAGPRLLADLVVATGLPRATTYRLAVALEAHGLVRRNDDGEFALGTRLVQLGRAAGESMTLAALARPTLEELRETTGESVQLYVRDGERRVCIESLESPNELRTIVSVGARLPLDRGSAGRLLAGGPAVDGKPWVASVGEREAGVASVSAPVRDASGRVVAAVSVSGPIERLTRAPGRRYGDAVVDAARAIEAAGAS
jgi:DNA-binding IclR family transcriptional regulator